MVARWPASGARTDEDEDGEVREIGACRTGACFDRASESARRLPIASSAGVVGREAAAPAAPAAAAADERAPVAGLAAVATGGHGGGALAGLRTTRGRGIDVYWDDGRRAGIGCSDEQLLGGGKCAGGGCFEGGCRESKCIRDLRKGVDVGAARVGCCCCTGLVASCEVDGRVVSLGVEMSSTSPMPPAEKSDDAVADEASLGVREEVVAHEK